MDIGTDIVAIARIQSVLEKFGDKFLARYLSQSEIALAKGKTERLAGFWAAKEAIAKALGCGIGGELSFLDITLHKNHKGKPYFSLSEQRAKYFNIQKSSLSISHDGGFAIAVVGIFKSE